MKFFRYIVDTYGVLLGGGSLAVVFVSYLLLVFFTRGLFLFVIPVLALGLIILAFLEYIAFDGEDTDK